MTDRDRSAIATWTRDHHTGPDPGRTRGKTGNLRYVCHECAFRCGQVGPALAHWTSTGHRVELAYRPKEQQRG